MFPPFVILSEREGSHLSLVAREPKRSVTPRTFERGQEKSDPSHSLRMTRRLEASGAAERLQPSCSFFSSLRSLRSLRLIGLAALPFIAHAATPIDFNRDIQPILSENCYQCHGPDV